MPLAHSLQKVSKNIANSKGQVHVKGRKYKQLKRATLRDKKLNTKKLEHQLKKQKELSVLYFIQELINNDGDKNSYNIDEMKIIIEGYLSRYDEELGDLRAHKRSGRPPTARQTQLEDIKQKEEEIYNNGFKIPLLSDPATVSQLKEWNGTTGGITALKFIQISRNTRELASQDVAMK